MVRLTRNLTASLLLVLTACSESEPYSPDEPSEDAAVAPMPKIEIEPRSEETLDIEAPPARPPQSPEALRAIRTIYHSGGAHTIYAPQITDPSAPPVVTLAEFNQLEPGMNYATAVTIIGAAGEKVSETTSDGSGAISIIYRWVNGDGSYTDITFTNQILTVKNQERLP